MVAILHTFKINHKYGLMTETIIFNAFFSAAIKPYLLTLKRLEFIVSLLDINNRNSVYSNNKQPEK